MLRTLTTPTIVGWVFAPRMRNWKRLQESGGREAQHAANETAPCMHNELNRCATHFNGKPTEMVRAKGMKARFSGKSECANLALRHSSWINSSCVDTAAIRLRHKILQVIQTRIPLKKWYRTQQRCILRAITTAANLFDASAKLKTRWLMRAHLKNATDTSSINI